MMNADFVKLSRYLQSPPENYWQFPTNVLTYTHGKKAGLMYFKGAVFTVLAKQLIMVSIRDDSTFTLADLRRFKSKFRKVRALGFAQPEINDIPVMSKSWEYYVDSEYDPEFKDLTSRKRNKKLRFSKKYDEEYISTVYSSSFPPPPSTLQVLQKFVRKWGEWREVRDMVSKGRTYRDRAFISHYLNWLEVFFSGGDNTWLLLLTDRDNNLIAFSGGEIVGDRGCVMLIKHLQEPPEIAKYLWLNTIRYLQSEGCEHICCGEMSDNIKKYLHFERYRLYKFGE